MSGKTDVGFPEWVEKYRGPGKTIKKTKSGYALYQCTSKYMPGHTPKSVQTYLGVIKEDVGFIPKKTSAPVPLPGPMYVEYGLSHLIWVNLRSKIAGALWNSTGELIKLGILGFIFGGFEEIYIRSCFLTYQDADRYIRFLKAANPKRLQTAKGVVEREMRKAIPDEAEYDHVIRLLMLCVVDAGAGNEKRPVLSVFLREILEKNKLRFD